jgi:hypothetical protein
MNSVYECRSFPDRNLRRRRRFLGAHLRNRDGHFLCHDRCRRGLHVVCHAPKKPSLSRSNRRGVFACWRRSPPKGRSRLIIDKSKVTRMTSSTFSPTTRCNRSRCRSKPTRKATGSAISVAITGLRPDVVSTRLRVTSSGRPARDTLPSSGQ